MRRIGFVFGNPKKLLLRGVGLTAITAGAILGALSALPGHGQTQSQSAAAPPAYEYDVVSVKPNTNSGRGGVGSTSLPDGLSLRGYTLTDLINSAYALRNPKQLIDAPAWIGSEKFDVDARMEGSVMDALLKMSAEDRGAARRKMMQALLADRFKLVVHLETRELPVYTLLIGKSGVKMKEAKPGDTYPNGFKIPGGRGGGAGSMLFQTGPSGIMMTGQAEPIAQLIFYFSREVGRIVIDKTGLTGNYDFVFQFTPEGFRAPANLGEGGGGAGMALPPDFGAISIFTAVQEQLGLKLESGKAPIEVVVIDHVERPSGN
jgi:uncharacterized protein (TIGR03435 family)